MTATTFPEGESRDREGHAESIPRRSRWRCAGPSWAGNGFAVAVNGDAVRNLPAARARTSRSSEPGRPATSCRSCCRKRCGSSRRRTEGAGGHHVGTAGAGRGPRPGARTRGGRGAAPRAPALLPLLVAAERPVAEWLKPADGQPGAFRSRGAWRARRGIRALLPAASPRVRRLLGPRHTRRVGGGGGSARTRAGAAAGSSSARRSGTSGRATRAEATSTSRVRRRRVRPRRSAAARGRRATKWFSFDVPVDASMPLRWWSPITPTSARRVVRDPRGRAAGGRADASRQQGLAVLRRRVPVAPHLVEGRKKVTVRSRPGGREIAPVFGIRVVRA